MNVILGIFGGLGGLAAGLYLEVIYQILIILAMIVTIYLVDSKSDVRPLIFVVTFILGILVGNIIDGLMMLQMNLRSLTNEL